MKSIATRDPIADRWVGLALLAPALAVILVFFVAPLAMSAVVAFRRKDGGLTLEHFAKSFDLYTTDLLFTLAIVLTSTILIGLVAIAIAGYLTLGENPRAVAILRWLYRWPLFIPFVVAGQVMRTFLAKKFIDLAESPEVQAEGIVKQFNWYPGIDPQHVQSKMDQASWNKLFTDISPSDLSRYGRPFPLSEYFTDIVEGYERVVIK